MPKPKGKSDQVHIASIFLPWPPVGVRRLCIMLGRILDIPAPMSHYAHVEDMYHNAYPVSASEISASAEAGDEFAYSVNIWHNSCGDGAAIRAVPTSE